MKKINKTENSEIIIQKLKYKKGNSNNNKKIRKILEKEQNNYCAYTECKIAVAFSTDVEHFNPNLKGTEEDNYYNWFAVSSTWNSSKGNKTRWNKYQPILYPTDKDFEERIVYYAKTHKYKPASNPKKDKNKHLEEKNLIELLMLNKFELANERKSYIKYLQDKVLKHKTTISEIIRNEFEIKFCRAIETVFKIKID